MIVKVGEKELQNYLKLRYKHPVHISAMGSFSDYVSYTKRHLCSDGMKIVADLSGQVIDGTKVNLDGADLSGTLLEKTTLKNVNVGSLIIRDCGVAQVKFDHCKIARLDLRGTNTEQHLGVSFVNSVKFIGDTSFGEVKLRVSSIDKTFPCSTPIFDSCYVRGKPSFKVVDGKIVAAVPDLGRYRKCTIEDIKEYAIEYQESEAVLSSTAYSSHAVKDQLPSFRNFLIAKYDLKGDFIPDASGLALDKLNLSYGNWGKCDWSKCSMVETKWDHSNLEHSSFNSCSFDGHMPGWGMGWFERKYEASFKGALLTGGNFDNVRGRCAIFTGAIMNLVSAVGSNFAEAMFDKVQAKNSNFSYAHMELVQAKGMDASNSIMRDMFFMYGDAPEAKLNYSRLDGAIFDYTDLRRAEVKYASAVGASFSNVDAADANFTGTKLWANVSRMNLRGARLDHVENSGWEIEPGILAGLFGDCDPYIDERTKSDKMVDSTNVLKTQERSAIVKQDVKRMGNSKWRWALFAAAGALDMALGGHFFKDKAATICDLADRKWTLATCTIIAPIALALAAKAVVTYVAGVTVAALFMSSAIVPIVAVGVIAGLAAATWYTGAGQDSKEVKNIQARKVEFEKLHPDGAHLRAPEVVKAVAKDAEVSPAPQKKVAVETVVGKTVRSFVDRVTGRGHPHAKKATHGKHTEALASKERTGATRAKAGD